MQVTQVMAYELRGDRVAVWKGEDGSWIVTNTATGKSLLCLSCSQALDTFDRCLDSVRENKILN